MKPSIVKSARRRQGSALLIILAFVLLLTIITTAFLSKAMLEKTVSNASAGQTRTDLFALGAIDAILGDCQQEIAAGSTASGSALSKITVGSVSKTICTPVSAQTIVPSRTWQSAQVTQPNPLPTLLKRSACALTFYPTGSMYGAANYNSATYPPGEKTFTAADPNDSTSTPSLNGRYYSPARWNKALLLPKANLATTNYTDYTPNATFTVPDWILVQRDGTNPTAWSSSLTTAASNDVTTTNKNPVVGRYAYAIYDEGSTLDMNVTGFPVYTVALPVINPTSSPQRYYRTSLASVDLLKLLPSIGGTAFFTQNDINSIVGWRNYATLQATGSIPSYVFPTATGTNYFLNVQAPGSGYLHTGNTVNSSNNQTDRKFSSRQQLIDLLLNSVALNTAEQANLQNALQYLGTFSRDLNQPSYQPDANRPRMATGASGDPASAGGNAAAADDASSNSTLDSLGNGWINPSFPTTLVQTAFTRNDGSTANVGDPLVKKRFALNRLVWLTYAGPIATDSGTYSNATTTAIAATLKTQYGFTDAFLLQGGPTNIQKYFGLLWAPDTNDNSRSKWFYNGSATNVPADGATFANTHATTYSGATKITELGGGNFGMFSGNNTTVGPHDPDFFELIKAAIVAGSKAKTLTYTSSPNWSTMTNSGDTLHPYNVQYNNDVSLDYQVLQIGANIIDQSRTDGYTTEIVFDNGTGSGPYEVRGVENYPYLYRVRTGSMTLRKVSPATAVVPDNDLKDSPTQLTTQTYPTFNDTGVAALMQIPEIWNPHDINAPMGSPYPTYFRIVMDSTNPANLATGGTAAYSSIKVLGADALSNYPVSDAISVTDAASSSATVAASPVFSYNPGGAGGSITNGYAGQTITFNASNTALTFTVPTSGANAVAFREPTTLARPNFPAGSNLALGWTAPPTTDLVKIENSATTPALCYTGANTTTFPPTNPTGAGFLSDTPNPLNLNTAIYTIPANQPYLGFIFGLYPIQFVISHGAPAPANNYIYFSTVGSLNSTTNTYLTYRMQYADPVLNPTGSPTLPWVTYDVKYMAPHPGWASTPLATATSGNLVNPTKTGNYQSDSWQSFADPRTSRFGAPGGDNDATVTYYAAPGWATTEWLDPANGVLVSDRPDNLQGFIYETNRTGSNGVVYAFNTLLAPGWIANAGYNLFRWGPISQNTKSATSQGVLRYALDTSNASTLTYQPFYYADADGVVRRAMGGETPNNSTTSGVTPFGYPMATATSGYTYPNGIGVKGTQSESRPYILKRPFRSVAELGCVFSGTPWKNLDFSNPESGDSPLLDVFCISDTDDPNGLVAGKINLNTQQIPVLAAVLAEAYYDDVTPTKNTSQAGYIGGSGSGDIDYTGTAGSYTNAPFHLANWLVTGPETTLGTLGTTSGTSVTPLMNVRELVGKNVSASAPAAGTMGIDGTSTSNYAGFSNDIGTFYNPAGSFAASYYDGYNTRFREAAVRALSAVGETRVWNLMIDVVAQTGRYPSSAANASNFIVEGERRYWLHVAIDRYTGTILDRQIEEVRQ